MILGRIPGLALDRTGVALFGVTALVATGRILMPDVRAAIDIPTMVLLFSLMVISAQFRLSGFYSHIVRRIGKADLSPRTLLALLIGVVGILSAVLANDIVCLAVTPVLVEACAHRNLNPVPYLLALACAANVGSAATLIGNPQNILIGQVLKLSFGRYLLDALIPSVLGLGIVWLVIVRMTGDKWEAKVELPRLEVQPFSLWQTSKGLVVIGGLIVMFLAAPWPREIMALAAAGIVLCSRQMRSREMLGLVDWQLLVLFMSLFIVNYAMSIWGNTGEINRFLLSRGIAPGDPVWLFGSSLVLSNLVSNVPAVMLLLPSATQPHAGPILALSSTLAGNLLIVGSIANIIVIDQAARLGIKISWRDHARIGVPVAVLTLLLAAAWLWIIV